MLVHDVSRDYSGRRIYYCPNCKKPIERIDNRLPWDEIKYCKYCGQAVEWNDRTRVRKLCGKEA